MKNSEYWRGRFSLLEHSTYKTAQAALKEIEALYRQALYRTQKDIASWCTRFADDNGLSLTEARRLLGTKELEEFRWDVEQYVETAQKAGLDETWQKQLRNASAKVHISRLEAVETQIRQQIEELYAGQEEQLTKAVRRAAENAYTGTLRETVKGLDMNFQTVSLDKTQLDALTAKAWTTDDRTFRDRCWTNKTALVQAVHKGMTQSLLRGDSPAKLTDTIAKQFDVDRYKAGRLVYTETAYYSALAEKQGFKDLGVEKVEIIGTLDGSTCSICGQLDGKEIPLAQYEPGVTVPPFHPRCRCTTAPVIPEDFADGLRIARDEDGEQYYVPAGTKYENWRTGTTFTTDDSEQNFRSAEIDMNDARQFYANSGTILAHRVITPKYEIYVSDKIQHLKPLQPKRVVQILDDVYSILGNPTQNRPAIVIIAESELNNQSIATYSSLNNTVRIYEGLLKAGKKELFKYQRDGVYPYDRRSTLLHEFIHWQDAQEYQKLYGKITNKDDVDSYIRWIRKKSKDIIEKLAQEGYNIYDISKYAMKELQKAEPAYDEAYTEYRTKQYLTR